MPEFLQNILIILLAVVMTLDVQGIAVITGFPAIIGLFAGLIMGDMQTAMIIAGTFQLMNLGVAGLGGSSVPDYGLATIIGTFVAVRTGIGTGAALAVGLPVGMLAIQLDVLVKMLNTGFAMKAKEAANAGQFKKMNFWLCVGPLFFALKQIIPTTIMVFFGTGAVELILKVIPKWMTNGLNIAGGMLPVVGVALLLHYMPTKKYLSFLVAGFVFSAYLNLPVLAIGLLGFGAAYLIFNIEMNKSAAATNGTVNTQVEGDDYDE